MNFKIGQKVKVVEGTEDGGDDHLIGLEGCIVRTDDDYYYEVRLDGRGKKTYQFGTYQLEKVKTKCAGSFEDGILTLEDGTTIDGNLITAAPELLGELKKLIAWVDQNNDEQPANSRWSSVHAVIAEAEGKS